MDTESVAKSLRTSLEGYDYSATTKFVEVGKELGLEFLGVGATRVCYRLSRETVLKVQYSESNYPNQTRDEIKMWEKLKDTQAGIYLTPIVEYDRSDNPVWEVMKFARDKGDDSGLSFRVYERYPELASQRVDGFGENVGYYHGHKVLRDYGFPAFVDEKVASFQPF